MKNIDRINTQRLIKKAMSYEILYEWEDVFSKELGIPLHFETKLDYYIQRVPILSSLFRNTRLMFDVQMFPNKHQKVYNVIPQIVDYYFKEGSEYESFIKNYSHLPVVLLSSKEACDYIVSKTSKIRVEHLALSISDKYRITACTSYEKMYDIVFVGRQNKILATYIEQYIKDHPSLKYVYRKKEGEGFNYYSNDGVCLGSFETREEYMSLMKKARIGLYATPGIDGGEVRTNGFSQVTPRLLEYIACGCHVIARYRNNSDTDYYELNSICPNIDTYEDFEKRMDYCLNNTVDMEFYSDYLAKHYTSVRAKELREILNHL